MTPHTTAPRRRARPSAMHCRDLPTLRVPPPQTTSPVHPRPGPRAPTTPGRVIDRVGIGGWCLVIAAVAVAVAVLAVIAAIVVIAGDDDEVGDTGETSDQSGGIEFDDSPVTSPDGLELSGLNPDVRNDPPLVGDTLTLSYTLTNTTDEPVEFAYTYVGGPQPRR